MRKKRQFNKAKRVVDAAGNNVLAQSYQRSLTGSIQSKTTDSGVWNYGYDRTGQLTSEQFSNQQSSIYNQQFSYDPMGNREFSRESTQGTQKEITYQPNRLNQYTSISNSALPAPSSLLYDLNGNMTNDGVRAYSWDTRNQLVEVETLPNAQSLRTKVCFSYDCMGRRVSKDVYAWNSSQSQWSKAQSLLFFYDGWNLVKEIELNPQSEIVNQKSYVWGNDLSGSLQGAGGVGGLLCTISQPSAPGSTPQAYFPCYDHNGNVEKVISGSGAVVASFQYDAFGNTISESIAQGLMSKDFPVRFSTKYFDAETGLAYYGYRYYSPESGRWINREPLGEAASVNLMRFISNDPINMLDVLGLFEAGRAAVRDYLQKRGNPTPQFRTVVVDGATVSGYVTVYEPYSDAEIQAILDETPWGHSDMPGGDVFDYNLEDTSFMSSPINPVGIHNHFQDAETSLGQMEAAIANNCDRKAFERTAHRFQDAPAHFDKGYTGYFLGFNPISITLSLFGVNNTGIGHMGSILPWNEQPDSDKAAFDRAFDQMEGMYEKWREKCECDKKK